MGLGDYRSLEQDEALAAFFCPESKEQKALRKACQQQFDPRACISPSDGAWLYFLLKSQKALRGVEIGSLGGYSASWILKALQENSLQDTAQRGHLWTLERDPIRANFARESLEQLGFEQSLFQVLCGSAQEILEQQSEAFQDLDFVFIDANKASYDFYVRWALEHVKKGGWIYVDNFYLWGQITPEQKSYSKEAVLRGAHSPRASQSQWSGMRACWDLLQEDPRVQCMVLPTGEGLAVAQLV